MELLVVKKKNSSMCVIGGSQIDYNMPFQYVSVKVTNVIDTPV